MFKFNTKAQTRSHREHLALKKTKTRLLVIVFDWMPALSLPSFFLRQFLDAPQIFGEQVHPSMQLVVTEPPLRSPYVWLERRSRKTYAT